MNISILLLETIQSYWSKIINVWKPRSIPWKITWFTANIFNHNDRKTENAGNT